MSQVTENLTHPQFQLTEEEEEADILWNYNHIKHYKSAVKRIHSTGGVYACVCISVCVCVCMQQPEPQPPKFYMLM